MPSIFFSPPPDAELLASYPTGKQELHDRLLTESITIPLYKGLSYFQAYIKTGGSRMHPVLGDLDNFINEVDAAWNAYSGINYVSEYLKSQLVLNNTLSQQQSSSDEEHSSNEEYLTEDDFSLPSPWQISGS